MDPTSLRIMSWNVNGLRACTAGSGFVRKFRASGADIVAVQEVRATPEQLPTNVVRPRGWRTHYVAAEKKGYSGVGLLVKRELAPFVIETSLGDPDLDREGRAQIARFGRLTIANAYFPNGNGRDRDHSRIPFKLRFYEALFDALEPARAAGEPVLIMGDFNTAPAAIDLARPKQNLKTSGFTPRETEHLGRLLDRGWTDTFRHLHPTATGRYSWWSQRFGVRKKNIGWRIDLVVASGGAMPYLRDAFIWDHIKGSDHCPTGVDLDRAVLE